MRWLITGGGGMLGSDVAEVVGRGDAHVAAPGSAELDICDADAVDAAVARADVVVNCAAWTDVDGAETRERDAFAVNALGPGILARACARADVRLVHISTDYVFSGRASVPYTVDAEPAPVSAYGRTKLAGEWAVRAADPRHVVVRTAWLYGARGSCFPRTISRLVRERGAVDVVADQVGQPTWTRDVAEVVDRLVAVSAPGGVYHATSGGQCSWFDFARQVAAAVGGDEEAVRPTTSEAFTRPAPRPAYSVLDHDPLLAVGVQPIPHWRARWQEAAPVVLPA
ncbi:dTDP-4-dehydrorhamnose reductase [Cellulosimicrobium cellulans]|uniref:dTDP-4-dehydrorhamnose reductase n=1 Tax=Cellulosimicrobium cellulans TaxID=1710 RepID=UPI000848E55B|nr:dTDP-4-dehydrorhamnose reductase [Cellulosimicrobium cellulans]